MQKEMPAPKKIFLVLLQTIAACGFAPVLLLLWSVLAGGDLLQENYFSKRLLGNFLFNLPENGMLFLSFTAVFFIVAGLGFKERSEKMRFAAYGGFFLLMTALFLHFRIPAGIGLTLPVLFLGSIALFTANKKDPRKKLFPGKRSFASLPERFAALLFLGTMVSAAFFLYQEGAEYLLLNPKGILFLLLPMAGCLLGSGRKVRDYLFASGTGFVFLAVIFCFLVAVVDTIWVMDISIIFIFIFWEYQALLLLRGLLPEIRNLSLVFLIVLLLSNGRILPGIGDANIITLCVFILYIIGDNWERIIKKLRRRLDPERYLLAKPPKEGFAVQAWCLGAFVLISLTGKNGVIPFLFLTILLFCTGILKILLLKKWAGNESAGGKEPENREYFSLRLLGEYLPLLPQCCVILVFSILQVLVWEKGFLAAVLAAGCCAACIWNLGIVISGKDSRRLSIHASLYHAAASGGIFLFMILLYFYEVSSSVAASMGLLLIGCALLGEGAYRRSCRMGARGFILRKWIARIAAALGFAVIVLPGEPLQSSFRELSAVACGALAFFAVNVYYILKNKWK